jgi:hypothetical protein
MPATSERSKLYGKKVEVLDGKKSVGVGLIDYVGSGRFRVTLPGGRQPWGMIGNLEESPKGILRYVVRKTLDLPAKR